MANLSVYVTVIIYIIGAYMFYILIKKEKIKLGVRTKDTNEEIKINKIAIFILNIYCSITWIYWAIKIMINEAKER